MLLIDDWKIGDEISQKHYFLKLPQFDLSQRRLLETSDSCELNLESDPLTAEKVGRDASGMLIAGQVVPFFEHFEHAEDCTVSECFTNTSLSRKSRGSSKLLDFSSSSSSFDSFVSSRQPAEGMRSSVGEAASLAGIRGILGDLVTPPSHRRDGRESLGESVEMWAPPLGCGKARAARGVENVYVSIRSKGTYFGISRFYA